MEIITTNCPSCGAVYGGNITSRFITCEYCGTRFALSEDEARALGIIEGANPEPQLVADPPAPEDAVPMYVFARDACEKFLKGVDEDSFESSAKIVRGLGIEDEDIYLIHDDTFFKSGKNGFAITYAGFYCREMSDKKAHFVSWEDFADRIDPELGVDGYIRQDGVSICYFTDDDDVLCNQLISLYRRLYTYATTGR